MVNDANDPKIQAQEEAARKFMGQPFEPDRIGFEAPAASGKEPPAAFAANCAVCHGKEAEGLVGPSLVGVTAKPKRSPDDIVKLLADPPSYGLDARMPSFASLPESDRRTIADWLATLK